MDSTTKSDLLNRGVSEQTINHFASLSGINWAALIALIGKYGPEIAMDLHTLGFTQVVVKYGNSIISDLIGVFVGSL